MKKSIRNDFPIFSTTMRNRPLVYLDSAATSQKPRAVIDAIANFYAYENGTTHRALYDLSEKATERYEQIRENIASFIGAQPHEVVTTSGTTASLNMIAATFADSIVGCGDEVLITALEHHSNLLPWQRLCEQKRAELKIIPLLPSGSINMQAARELIGKKTKVVSATHVSNALGVTVDVAQLAQWAHEVGAIMVVDAAQSVGHRQIDVSVLGCDFLAFSAHKMLAPTGVGILYINKAFNGMPPSMVGGGMVLEANYRTARWLASPHKFEAGTQPIAPFIGLGAAVDYYNQHIDFDLLESHEEELCLQLIDGLKSIPGVTVLGPLEELVASHLVSFTVDGIHAHDVAAFLNTHGICVRAGHHCAQPLAQRLGLAASVRVSFHCYNTADDVELLLCALHILCR